MKCAVAIEGTVDLNCPDDVSGTFSLQSHVFFVYFYVFCVSVFVYVYIFYLSSYRKSTVEKVIVPFIFLYNVFCNPLIVSSM